MRSLPMPVLAFLVASCIEDPPTKFEPPAVCALALKCYFGVGPDAGTLEPVPTFEGLFPSGDNTLVADAYGRDGSCWRGDEALAESCENRCKGLLWQDCAVSYNRACSNDGRACGTSGECQPDVCEPAPDPFCPQACDASNVPPCHVTEDGGLTVCPVETDCNADKEAPLPSIGCCDVKSRDISTKAEACVTRAVAAE